MNRKITMRVLRLSVVVLLVSLFSVKAFANECSSGNYCPTISDVTEIAGGHFAHNNGLSGGGYLGASPWSIVIIDSGVVLGDANLGASKSFPSGCFADDLSCDGASEAINGSGLGLPLSGGYGERHGTAVASVAAAGGNNFFLSEDANAVGMAPMSKVISIRLYGMQDPAIFGPFLENLRKALEYTADLVDAGENIAVVNISSGDIVYAIPLSVVCDSQNPELFQAVQALRDRGVLVVASAGNVGPTSLAAIPACLSNVLSVSSILSTGELDTRTNHSGDVDLVAPGSMQVRDITSTDSRYSPAVGTSLAAPVVAGGATLLYDCAASITSSGGVRTSETDDMVEAALLDVVAQSTTIDGINYTFSAIDISQAMRYFAQPDNTMLGSIGSLSASTLCANKGFYDPLNRDDSNLIGQLDASTTWQWVAPNTGPASVSTCNSGTTATTYLAVYEGDYSFGIANPSDALELIDSAENGVGCSDSRGASIEFDAVQGVRYIFQVGPISAGYFNYGPYMRHVEHGTYELSWGMETLSVPGKPTLNAPINRVMVPANAPVNLSFAELDDQVTRYQIRLFDRSVSRWTYSNITTPDSICELGNCSVQIDGLDGQKNATWKVRAFNAAGWGAWSDSGFFDVVDTTVPVKPDLQSPIERMQVLPDTPVTLTFFELEGSVSSYQIRLYDRSLRLWTYSSISAPADICDQGSCSVVADGMSVQAKATWKVRARNGAGWGAWSDPAFFDVVSTDLPAAPVLLSPVDGFVLAAHAPITLNFAESTDTADKYQIRFFDRSVSLWTESIIESSSSICARGSCSVEIAGVDPQSKATWKVRAFNSAGWGDWSDAGVFDTEF